MADRHAFAGRAALVTGASRGIGAALVSALAARGARLGLVGRDVEALEAGVARAREQGVEAHAFRCDLVRVAEVRELARAVDAALGPLDLLLHGAGAITLGPVARLPVGELDRHYATNLRAPYLLTQLLLPGLSARAGQIAFLNSTLGLAAREDTGAYAATKAGLRFLADSLRAEVADARVRVLSVFLGRTASPMQAALHAREGTSYRPEEMMRPADVAEVVLDTLALPPGTELTDLTLRPQRGGPEGGHPLPASGS